METIDSSDLVEMTVRKVKALRKSEQVALAKELNNENNTIDRFEQFSRPVQIDNLTKDQLCRYVEGKLKTVEKDQLISLVQRYRSFDNINLETCAVCMEIMGKQKNSLSCGHWIHFTCMRKAKTRKCPLCRADVGACIPWSYTHQAEMDLDRMRRTLATMFPRP